MFGIASRQVFRLFSTKSIIKLILMALSQNMINLIRSSFIYIWLYYVIFQHIASGRNHVPKVGCTIQYIIDAALISTMIFPFLDWLLFESTQWALWPQAFLGLIKTRAKVFIYRLVVTIGLRNIQILVGVRDRAHVSNWMGQLLAIALLVYNEVVRLRLPYKVWRLWSRNIPLQLFQTTYSFWMVGIPSLAWTCLDAGLVFG